MVFKQKHFLLRVNSYYNKMGDMDLTMGKNLMTMSESHSIQNGVKSDTLNIIQGNWADVF